MESRNTQYPVYIPDQYLTNKNLNDTTDYLEIEERATRSYTIGNGIISRLNITEINKPGGIIKGIKITNGYGLTPDGFLLETEKKNAFIQLSFATNEGSFHYIKTGGKNIIINGANAAKLVESGKLQASDLNPIQFLEIFEQQPDNAVDKRNVYADISIAAAKISGFNTNDCVLVLVADVSDTKYDKCAQGDCNDRGTDRVIKCRYLLIPTSVLAIPFANKKFTSLGFLELPRLNNIREIKNLNDYNFKVLGTFKSSTSAIALKLKSIMQTGEGILSSDFDQADVIKKLEQLSTVSSGNIYGLSFVNDLQQAVNEYIVVYNAYAAKYSLFGNSRIDRLLILGALNNTNATDPSRYYYQAIQQEKLYEFELQLLLKHFNRILVMVLSYANIDKQDTTWFKNTFPGGNNNPSINNIRLIPSKEPHSLLGTKAIPYYYNTKIFNNILPLFWNAHAFDVNNQLVYNYYASPFSASADVKVNIQAYNFFRLEGCIGVTAKEAEVQLASLISKNDLCISLLAIDITKAKTQSLNTRFNDYKTLMNDLVVEMKKEDSKKKLFTTLYAIQTDLSTQNIADTAGLLNILGRSSAYLNEMVQYQKRDKNDPQTIAIKQNILPFRNTNETQEAKVVNIIKNSGILEAKKELETAIKDNATTALLTLGDINGLEYLGGVYKGGTIILLSDGQKVIGDCSLPYFYGHK